MYPGDPPLFDVALELGLVLAALGGAAFLVTRLVQSRGSRGRFSRTLLYLSLAVAALGVSSGVVGGFVVGSRHFGAWTPIRDAIRRESHRIEERTGGRTLTGKEFETFQAELARENLRFRLPGWKQPVSIGMTSLEPPYVAVFFGGSWIATFDPLTMICQYAE